jgi:phenylalanyl-tRNA synthetase beta chain
MKVTLNWLKQYVDFNWTPEELRERLTMVGIEVEGMQKMGGEWDGVVVAQILAFDKHPNADKLSVCRVSDGQTEKQIVCGAKNFQVGDKVPLALPGCTLPSPGGEPPFTIKVGKLRGVESQGMMCSAKELGISEDAAGLLILPADATVGQSFAEHQGKAGSDVVYDLEITPNRPDLNSVIGIAREIGAVTGNPLRIPEIKLPAPVDAPAVDGLVGVRIEDSALCPRYTARLVRGVKVGPSPAWLKQTLENAGIRSISNVVDVTNFVMMEIGQPLHAFDYHLLSRQDGAEKPVIVVRRAGEGEKFTTLDGQQRTLTPSMLVIADETKAVALAGIMGGLNSEIKETTVDVLIESAYFKPQSIRATSKQLELRSDASYRFERGADLGISDWASRRAAQLILETAGGRLADGVVDAYPQPFTPKTVTLRHVKSDQLLGVALSPQIQDEYLKRLDLERVSSTDAASEFRIPSFRVDLKREIDLIEEVGRLYGIDKIPSRTPSAFTGANAYDGVHDQIAEARRILVGLGLDETQGQTLIADVAAKAVSDAIAPLQNPLSADMNVLRPSLLPGLLDALQRNANRKTSDLALFEIGRAFTGSAPGIREERRLAIAITGQRNPLFWSGSDRDAKLDISDLKGIIEEFLEFFGLRGIGYVRAEGPQGLFLESAGILLGKNSVGQFGQLMPATAKKYDLRDPVLMAELNLDLLLARRNTAKSFKPLPQFPSIRRDVAMIVPESATHDAVLSVVKQTKPLNLERVDLFDVFRGKNVPEGQKSMAYAFIYRNTEKTLTDAEVNGAHDKLVEQFKQKLQAVIREG